MVKSAPSLRIAFRSPHLHTSIVNLGVAVELRRFLLVKSEGLGVVLVKFLSLAMFNREQGQTSRNLATFNPRYWISLVRYKLYQIAWFQIW